MPLFLIALTLFIAWNANSQSTGMMVDGTGRSNTVDERAADVSGTNDPKPWGPPTSTYGPGPGPSPKPQPSVHATARPTSSR